MSLAVISSVALQGLASIAVRVEVHLSTGLPAFSVVGSADARVKESRERVRSAIACSGFNFPSGRVTVNLAPADLPKDSGRYDLPIALGILLASGQLNGADRGPDKLHATIFAGELSLTGAVVPITGALAIALSVARQGEGLSLVLPLSDAGIAAQIPEVSVFGVATLEQAVQFFYGGVARTRAKPVPAAGSDTHRLCMSDVYGQAQARRVLEVAAAGGHSVLLCGPPGVGKSMLAQRLPGLLPALSPRQSLEVAAVTGLRLGQPVPPVVSPPFRAPHHTSTAAALLGGGAVARPGEISLSHGGVLFLDELPHFDRRALEGLREPLEQGQVSIARAARTLVYPAGFQLVAAMNPCPCGWRGHTSARCLCSDDAVTRYRRTLSGPLLDRIDLQITLSTHPSVSSGAPVPESSAAIARRVAAVRALQVERQGLPNARLSAADIRRYCELDQEGGALLARAQTQWAWSTRVVHRVLRVALTIADLAGCPCITVQHLAEAAQYRQPWPDDVQQRVGSPIERHPGK